MPVALQNAGPKWLYLHGFASGPDSAKGRALSAHFATQGISLERLNLRVPSLEQLRLSAMTAHSREKIGSASDRAVLFGSSLGGLAACRVAEQDARVFALVLLAPALRLAGPWRRRLGEDAWGRWEREGGLEVDDHAEKRRTRVDFGFIAEIAEMERLGARDRGEGGRGVRESASESASETRLEGGFCADPDVRVPTLIVHGVRDEVPPP